ncbi:hypothetical protein Taro_010526 [Colocasia esculenta]|uniref:Cupin type-1 domain-containing protein n=1 Tax=Colocasia esculenta TaxID=4460 RepID=A0A843UDC6_COLES|nr:hypothetical protein [Colocasia esculenta]
MAAPARPFSSLLFLCLLLLIPPLLFSFAEHLREDPELQQCRRRCQQEEGSRGERQLRECERTCEEAAWRRQSEREEREREREPGGGGAWEKLQQCRKHCREEHGEEEGPQLRRCQQWCQERYREEREEQEREGEGEGRRREQEERNPYYFGEESFAHTARTEHGRFKVLQKFSRRSELLRGIERYRLAVLEAEPSAFALPSHWDAEEILYVVKGRGVVTMLHGCEEGAEQGRESHEISEGDVLWVPAGTNTYLVNTDKNQRLHVAMVLKTISTIPGEYREFFGVGGRDPESFFRVFSNEILEAAFNTRREKLERVFGQHQQGAIVKASEEQIREMRRGASEEGGGGGIWPFGGGERNKPYKLLKKKPSHSNQHGRMYEVDQDEYKQLCELDLDVSLANVTAGSMIAPSYNSKATKLVLVTSGDGYIEMACPHLSRRQQGADHYVKVRSKVSPGTVFVIPPGHPVVIVAASGGENLQVLCFGLHARGNRKYFLAGKNSVLRNLQREAGELSLGVPWKEAKEVLDSQTEAVFLKGPEQGRKGEGGERTTTLPEYSILDAASF